MTFQIKHGDMFSEPSDAYAHGVNVYGVMGAGVAAVIRRKFPSVYTEYAAACADGTLTPGNTLPVQDTSSGAWVYNCASQDRPGPYANRDWLMSSLSQAFAHAHLNGVRTLALPLIGGGIGGLDPQECQREIEITAHMLGNGIVTTLWLYP
jgi:O-acetyl-ADP-ribose deacetylase (regulator of RNase III)